MTLCASGLSDWHAVAVAVQCQACITNSQNHIMHACMVAENTVRLAAHAVLHGMSSQLPQQHCCLLCADQEEGAGVEGEAGVPQLQQGVQATLEVLQK